MRILRSMSRPAAAALLTVFVALAPALAQDDGADRLRATVGDEEIRQSDVDAFIQQLPPQVRSAPREQIEPLVVDELINVRLVVRKAREAGIDDDKDYKQQVAVVSERILQNLYLQRQIDDQMTEERVKARYDEFVAANPPADQVRASHILVDTKEEAAAVLEEIRDGADFEAVAREKSNDPAASAGGDLGYFEREQMVATFADAAFAMDVDEVSEPVQTQFGWHIIKVTDRRKSPPPPLDQVRGEIEQALSNEIVQEVLSAAREDVDVVTYDENGEPIAE